MINTMSMLEELNESAGNSYLHSHIDPKSIIEYHSSINKYLSDNEDDLPPSFIPKQRPLSYWPPSAKSIENSFEGTIPLSEWEFFNEFKKMCMNKTGDSIDPHYPPSIKSIKKSFEIAKPLPSEFWSKLSNDIADTDTELNMNTETERDTLEHDLPPVIEKIPLVIEIIPPIEEVIPSQVGGETKVITTRTQEQPGRKKVMKVEPKKVIKHVKVEKAGTKDKSKEVIKVEPKKVGRPAKVEKAGTKEQSKEVKKVINKVESKRAVGRPAKVVKVEQVEKAGTKENSKEDVKKYLNNQKKKCDTCGIDVYSKNMAKHVKTQKHLKNLEDNNKAEEYALKKKVQDIRNNKGKRKLKARSKSLTKGHSKS